jgi:hypothetical protein
MNFVIADSHFFHIGATVIRDHSARARETR